jgi:predicted Zn-dependent peptidase
MIHKFYKTQSRLATIIIGFECGSKLESKFKYNYGVSHALEHNIFKHYNGLNSLEISKKVSHLGGHTNAYTSNNYVAYYIELPVEHIQEGLKILKGMASDAIVSDEEFIKEMEVIKEEEIASRDSVSGSMWNKFSENYFDNHLSVPIIGTKESISKITKDEVQRFHKEFCSFDKSIICISANMSKKDAMSMMRDFFGKQSGKIAKTKMKKSKYKKSQELFITRSDLEHTSVWMGMPNKNDEYLDVEAYLINSMLSNGMDSRLYEEIREKRGLVYSVESFFANMGDGNINMFSFKTRDKNKNEVISLINEEIERFQSGGFSEEEIVRAKNKARTNFYRATETSSGMAHDIFRSVVNKELGVEEFMKKVELITNDDLIYASNLMFDTDKCLTLTCKGE